ncbi:MAG: trigger factor [Oscillospiraceae bacterium]|jgi:trigger factor|nr:trigger factor [Oscillospiraceae bacterium]
MGLKSTNKIGTNRYELEVEVDAETFNIALDKVFRRKVKKISVPGFRKGKAPRAFIEKYYGAQVFYEDAVNDIYPQILENAIDEAGLDLVKDKIDFDVVKIGKDEGLVFKAAVTTKPEVQIDGYKGLKINAKSCKVTKEDVKAELQKIREQNARIVPVDDRPAWNGDTVIIDFKGFVDGNSFEGGSSENFSLKLGSNQFIKGFEEKIVSHSKGENFKIEVPFPAEYPMKHLAGKDVIFEIKIHEIKGQELPDLNDEFVKDVSEFDTLDEYQKHLEKEIEERKKNEAEQDKINQISDHLTKLMKADIPEAMIESRIDEEVQRFERHLKTQDIDLDSYLTYNNISQDEFRKNLQPTAHQQVQVRLALEKIAELESIIPTEQEVESEYQKISENYKIDIEKVKLNIKSSDISKDIAVRKAIDFLKDSSVS